MKELPYVYPDDPSIPEQVVYRYFIFNAVVQLSFAAIFITFIIAVTINESHLMTATYESPSTWLGWIGIAVLISALGALGFVAVQRIRDQTPQLIIGEEGITTNSGKLHCWEHIRSEKVVVDRWARGNPKSLDLLRLDGSGFLWG